MAEAKKIKARVLIDCTLGKCNDVVELSEDQVKAHEGQIDTHPKAVAHAESGAPKKPAKEVKVEG